MLLTTLPVLPNVEMHDHFGIVSGSTVRTRHVFRDVFASVKNIFGGELKGYTSLLNEARDEAIQRMIQQAEGLGANAIMNIRITTGAVARGAAEIYVYGTALRIEAKSA